MPDPKTKGIDDDLEQDPLEVRKGDTYYVFIAINKYRNKETENLNPFNDLANPKKDVELIKGKLKEIYEIDEDKIFFLEDEKATKKEIRNLLKGLPVGEDDALLIYFSGHGHFEKSSDTFYLIPYKGDKDDEDSWLDPKILYSYFKDYSAKKKCRDLLLVLDCCNAGGLKFGFGKNSNDNFSRYVLGASEATEKALDGSEGEGSPFARAFCKVLDENSKRFFTIEEIQNKFSNLLSAYSQNKQSLIFESLPETECGQSHFEFHLREKKTPRPDHLERTILEHLDFEEQRGVLKKNFNRRNGLNIITSFGSGFDSHQLLHKALFKWIFKKVKLSHGFDIHQIDFSNSGINKVAERICSELLKGEESSTDFVKETVNYLFERLTADFEDEGIRKHFIIWIRYDNGDEDWIDEVQQFCIDLTKAYTKKVKELEGNLPAQIGRIFFILSDERKKEEPEELSALIAAATPKDFNLLITPKIEALNLNHFDDWKEKAEQLITIKIPEISDQDIFKEEMELDIKDFISRVCEFCEFPFEVKMKFQEKLYDFRK